MNLWLDRNSDQTENFLLLINCIFYRDWKSLIWAILSRAKIIFTTGWDYLKIASWVSGSRSFIVLGVICNTTLISPSETGAVLLTLDTLVLPSYITFRITWATLRPAYHFKALMRELYGWYNLFNNNMSLCHIEIILHNLQMDLFSSFVIKIHQSYHIISHWRI